IAVLQVWTALESLTLRRVDRTDHPGTRTFRIRRGALGRMGSGGADPRLEAEDHNGDEHRPGPGGIRCCRCAAAAPPPAVPQHRDTQTSQEDQPRGHRPTVLTVSGDSSLRLRVMPLLA